MSVSVSVKKFKGREYVYICESFRDPQTRRPTSRVLKSFGRKDKLLEQNPNAMELIEQQARQIRENTDTYRQTLEERLGAGVRMTQEAASARPIALSCTPAPYFRRWEMLGLSDYFTNYRRNHKIPYDLRQAVFQACLERIVAPAVRGRTRMNRGRYLFDFGEVSPDDVRRCSGVAARCKANIIRRLGESIGKMYRRDLTAAEVRLTGFCFGNPAGDQCRRQDEGRNHRTPETQVVLGLLLDSEGVPFTYELLLGDTVEAGTLVKTVDELKRRYDIKDVTVVADSGLPQTVDLGALGKSGVKCIVGWHHDRETENAEDIGSALRQVESLEEAFRLPETDLPERPDFSLTPEHLQGHFLVSWVAFVMQRILQRSLQHAGVRASGRAIVLALESVRVSRVVGMGKGKGLLFNCAGSDGETAAVTKGGAPVTQAELFDLIMGVCDLEPLSGLESEASLRRKLKVRLPLTRFSSDKIR